MSTSLKTGVVAGAAAIIASAGLIAGIANGESQPSETAPKGEARQTQIAAQQAVELKEQAAEEYNAIATRVATSTTSVGDVTESHFTRDGKTIRICVGVVYAAGGGSQTCRDGEKLRSPLLLVGRDRPGTINVAGLAPGSGAGDVAITKADGQRTATGVSPRASQRAIAASSSPVIAAELPDSQVDSLTFRSPETGTKDSFSLADTIAAVDAG